VGGVKKKVNFPVVDHPRDTTGAGDSFNAGYLAGRLKGVDPVRAARQGCRLAAEVIRHPGAIIPRSAMPVMKG
jgi:2-dehydro-3-deoxygluconokinase